MAFKAIDIDLEFKGKGEQEIAIDKVTGKILMKVNPKFYRPAEVELLIGDPSKAKAILKWEPKTKLEELCSMMVKADITRNKNGISF
jgi:GDPmannose 4,6-dehydratase